jgi:RNA polymerase sigma-70 factor (ECF subfamily)
MKDCEEIRQQYGTLIFSAAYRILKRHDQALDCYQEVLLEVFEQCKERPVRNWPALLRWITVRRALDRLRSERRFSARVEAEKNSLLLLDTGGGPSEAMEFRELVDRVRDEVARLPERQGEAFWLRCVEQLSTAEVAEQLGTDANSVGVLVHRARAKLRDVLADVNPGRVGQ